jgi:hypothetical protein
MRNTINVGCETWEYEVSDGRTKLYDDDGKFVIELDAKATKREIEAAIEGYFKGYQYGRKRGQEDKVIEIRKALMIDLSS